MLPPNRGIIPSYVVSPLLSPGVAAVQWSARLRRKLGNSVCAQPCRRVVRTPVPGRNLRGSGLHALYRDVSRLTREIFKRHTELAEPLSLDEAYLDVTENKTPLPTATRVASTIREQIRQELSLTASAGVAPNKFLAKLSSDWRKPDGIFVIQPDDVETFLTPLPVARLPGVGKVTEEKLEKLGVKTEP
jgi:impB/mucB/samB family/IMS family HHH motif